MLLRLYLNCGGRIVGGGERDGIDGKNFFGVAEAGAGVGGVAVVINEEFGDDGFGFRGRGVGIQQVLIADYQDALGEAGDLFIGALDAFDDHGAGRAAENLWLAEAVDVRVIPVEAGRLVFWDAKFVLEGWIAGLDGSF